MVKITQKARLIGRVRSTPKRALKSLIQGYILCFTRQAKQMGWRYEPGRRWTGFWPEAIRITERKD